MKTAFISGIAALFLATGAAHACEDSEKGATGKRLGDCWLARINRTDQSQFDVSVWQSKV
jgi:hypothetical protein